MIKKIAYWIQNAARKLIVKRNEPVIRQKQDVNGNFYWQVYDYKLNQSLIFGTDTEVKMWLEQRHYQWTPSTITSTEGTSATVLSRN